LSMKKRKPSVSTNDLERYIEWTKSFGQEG
jgi:hypothetical protein